MLFSSVRLENLSNTSSCCILMTLLFRRCNFDKNLRHYRLIPYSSSPNGVKKFIDELATFLKGRNVSDESISFIRQQMTQKRTDHTTVDSEARIYYEKLLRTNPYHMELLVKMFYFDFSLLGFPFPQLIL